MKQTNQRRKSSVGFPPADSAMNPKSHSSTTKDPLASSASSGRFKQQQLPTDSPFLPIQQEHDAKKKDGNSASECRLLMKCIVDLLLVKRPEPFRTQQVADRTSQRKETAGDAQPPLSTSSTSTAEVTNIGHNEIEHDARLTQREVLSLFTRQSNTKGKREDGPSVVLASDPWPETEWKCSLTGMEIVSELFGGNGAGHHTRQAMEESSSEGADNFSPHRREFANLATEHHNNGGPSDDTSPHGATFYSFDDSAVIHIWRSRRAAHRFISSLRDIAQVCHELLLPSCWSTLHTATLAYGGAVLTVTWLPPVAPTSSVYEEVPNTTDSHVDEVRHVLHQLLPAFQNSVLCIAERGASVGSVYFLPTFCAALSDDSEQPQRTVPSPGSSSTVCCELRCISACFPSRLELKDTVGPTTRRLSHEGGLHRVRLADEAVLIQAVVLRLLSSPSLAPPSSLSTHDLTLVMEKGADAAPFPSLALRSAFWQSMNAGGGVKKNSFTSSSVTGFTVSSIFHDCGVPLGWIRRVRDTILSMSATSGKIAHDEITAAASKSKLLQRWYVAEVLGAEMVARTLKNIVSSACSAQFAEAPLEEKTNNGASEQAVPMLVGRRASVAAAKQNQPSSPLQRRQSTVSSVNAAAQTAAPVTANRSLDDALAQRRAHYEKKANSVLDIANQMLPILFHDEASQSFSASVKRSAGQSSSSASSAVAAVFVKDCLIPSMMQKYYHHNRSSNSSSSASTTTQANETRRREREDCERLVQWWLPLSTQGHRDDIGGYSASSVDDLMSRSINAPPINKDSAAVPSSSSIGPRLFLLRHLSSRLGFHFNVAVNRFDRLSSREMLRSSGRSAATSMTTAMDGGASLSMLEAAKSWMISRLQELSQDDYADRGSRTSVMLFFRIVAHWLLRTSSVHRAHSTKTNEVQLRSFLSEIRSAVIKHMPPGTLSDDATEKEMLRALLAATVPSTTLYQRHDTIREQRREISEEELARGYLINKWKGTMDKWHDAFSNTHKKIALEDAKRQKERDLLDVAQLSARTQAAVPSEHSGIAAPRPPPSIFAQLLSKAANSVIVANRIASEAAQARPRLLLTKQRSAAGGTATEGSRKPGAVRSVLHAVDDSSDDDEEDGIMITHRPTLAGDVRKIRIGGHHHEQQHLGHSANGVGSDDGSSSPTASPTASRSPGHRSNRSEGGEDDASADDLVAGSPTASMESAGFAESILRNIVFDTEEETIAGRQELLDARSLNDQNEQARLNFQAANNNTTPDELVESAPSSTPPLMVEFEQIVDNEVAVVKSDGPAPLGGGDDYLLNPLELPEQASSSVELKSLHIPRGEGVTQPPTPNDGMMVEPLPRQQTPRHDAYGIDQAGRDDPVQEAVPETNERVIVTDAVGPQPAAEAPHPSELQEVTVVGCVDESLNPPPSLDASDRLQISALAQDVHAVSLLEPHDDACDLVGEADATDAAGGEEKLLKTDNELVANEFAEPSVEPPISAEEELPSHVNDDLPKHLEPTAAADSPTHPTDANLEIALEEEEASGAPPSASITACGAPFTQDPAGEHQSLSLEDNITKSASLSLPPHNADAPTDDDATLAAPPTDEAIAAPTIANESALNASTPPSAGEVAAPPPPPPQHASEEQLQPQSVEERIQHEVAAMEADEQAANHDDDMELDALFAMFAPRGQSPAVADEMAGERTASGGSQHNNPRSTKSKPNKHAIAVPISAQMIKEAIKKFKKIESDSRGRLIALEHSLHGTLLESYAWSWLQSRCQEFKMYEEMTLCTSELRFEAPHQDNSINSCSETNFVQQALSYFAEGSIAVEEVSVRNSAEGEMLEEHVAFGSVLCLFVDAWMDLCAEELHAWEDIMAANESDQRTAHGLARWRKKRLDAYYSAREADLAARHEQELREANVEMAVAKARRRAREAKGRPTTTDPLPPQSLGPEEDALERKQRKVLLAHMERRKLQETRREQALQQTSVERSNAMRQSPHDASSSVEVESITSSLHHRRTHALHAHQARRRAQEERRGRQALQPPMDMRAVDAEHHQQVMELLVASVKMNDDLAAEPHGLGGTTTPPPRRQHEGDVASPPGKLEPMFSPEEIQRRLDEAELEYERKGVTFLSRREQERRIALRAEKLRSFHPAKPSY